MLNIARCMHILNPICPTFALLQVASLLMRFGVDNFLTDLAIVRHPLPFSESDTARPPIYHESSTAIVPS